MLAPLWPSSVPECRLRASARSAPCVLVKGMDMERCVCGRGVEGVERGHAVSHGACKHVLGGALLSRSLFGAGWIPLLPANRLLTQIPHWNLPYKNAECPSPASFEKSLFPVSVNHPMARLETWDPFPNFPLLSSLISPSPSPGGGPSTLSQIPRHVLYLSQWDSQNAQQLAQLGDHQHRQPPLPLRIGQSTAGESRPQPRWTLRAAPPLA